MKVALLALLCLSRLDAWQAGYDELLAHARTHIANRSFAQALESAESAIRLDGTRWEAHAVAGSAAALSQRWGAAIRYLDRALQLAPEQHQPAIGRAREEALRQMDEVGTRANAPAPLSQASTGSVTQAELVLWRSIENKKEPGDFQAYLEAYPQGAFVPLARRKLEEAKRARQQVLDTERTRQQEAVRVNALWGKAEEAHRARQYRAAAEHFNVLLSLKPQSPEVQCAWAEAHLHLLQFEYSTEVNEAYTRNAAQKAFKEFGVQLARPIYAYTSGVYHSKSRGVIYPADAIAMLTPWPTDQSCAAFPALMSALGTVYFHLRRYDDALNAFRAIPAYQLDSVANLPHAVDPYWVYSGMETACDKSRQCDDDTRKEYQRKKKQNEKR